MLPYSGLVRSPATDLVAFHLSPGVWAIVRAVSMLGAGVVLLQGVRR